MHVSKGPLPQITFQPPAPPGQAAHSWNLGFKTNSRPNFYGSLFCFYVIIILVTQPPIFELSLVFLSLYILLEILSQKDREDSSQGPAMSELKVLDWEVY